MLEGEGEGGGESSSTHRGGWWVQYFPADEADHVWRLLVNAHVKSNLFGSVMHFTGPGFGRRPGAEVEARVLVRDRAELSEMRRVGAGLMAASPTHAQRDFMLFHAGPLPKVPPRPPSPQPHRAHRASAERGECIPCAARRAPSGRKRAASSRSSRSSRFISRALRS